MTKRKNKPKRPSGCPLYPNSNGTWAATLAGKKRSFGGWPDLPAPLRKYELCKAAFLMREDPFDKSAQPSKRASSKTISETYRTENNVPDHQIRRVSQHLHAWLYKADTWREVASLKDDIHSDEYQPQPVYKDCVIVGRRQVLPHPQEALDALLKDHPELK